MATQQSPKSPLPSFIKNTLANRSALPSPSAPFRLLLFLIVLLSLSFPIKAGQPCKAPHGVSEVGSPTESSHRCAKAGFAISGGAALKGVGRGLENARKAIGGICGRKAVRGGAKAVDANKLHHIFGRGGHGLDDVVKAAGSREAAFGAMEKAAQGAFDAGKLVEIAPGVFEGPASVGGVGVTVRGAVVDGVFRIGSAWR